MACFISVTSTSHKHTLLHTNTHQHGVIISAMMHMQCLSFYSAAEINLGVSCFFLFFYTVYKEL